MPGIRYLSEGALERNDVRQYDELVEAWWDSTGSLAMLSWIAEARGALIPPAGGEGAVLVDLGCGGGLTAPHIARKNYRHVGVDLTMSALRKALDHGVSTVNADVFAVPLRNGCADVVCAGEILEHVQQPERVVAEICRLLTPGGMVVLDTIANTAIARFLSVTVAERIRGGAPRGIHDPSLFIDRRSLVAAFASHGVELHLRGLRPSILSWLAWRLGRRAKGRMLVTRSTAVLFQAWGVKRP